MTLHTFTKNHSPPQKPWENRVALKTFLQGALCGFRHFYCVSNFCQPVSSTLPWQLNFIPRPLVGTAKRGTEGTLQRPTTGHHNAAWVRAGVSGRRGHALEKRRPHLQKRQEKRKAPRKEHAKLLGLEAGGLHGVVEKATPARDPLWNLLNAISLSDRPGINCRS